MSRFPPSPRICTPARPSRSGSSTATSLRSRSRCCRWRRWARSSAIAASIWRAWRCSRWPRCSAPCRTRLLLLTVARIVQGFGAAGIMSVNAALVRFTYPHATSSDAASASMPWWWRCRRRSGRPWPRASWRSGRWPYLFAVNIPFGIAALVVGWRCLPHTPRRGPCLRLAEAPSSARSPSALGIAAIDSAGHGEASSSVPDRNSARRDRRRVPGARQTPALRRCCRWICCAFRFSPCRSRTSIASFCAQMMAFVALPFYLQERFGYSAVQIGLLITPWPIAVAFTAPIAGRLVGTLSGWPVGRHRAGRIRRRPWRAGADAGASHLDRHHLAHGAGGRRVSACSSRPTTAP